MKSHNVLTGALTETSLRLWIIKTPLVTGAGIRYSIHVHNREYNVEVVTGLTSNTYTLVLATCGSNSNGLTHGS